MKHTFIYRDVPVRYESEGRSVFDFPYFHFHRPSQTIECSWPQEEQFIKSKKDLQDFIALLQEIEQDME